jgi:hypothetical protein
MTFQPYGRTFPRKANGGQDRSQAAVYQPAQARAQARQPLPMQTVRQQMQHQHQPQQQQQQQSKKKNKGPRCPLKCFLHGSKQVPFHKSENCTWFRTVGAREYRFRELGKCPRCKTVEINHVINDCKNFTPCKYCRKTGFPVEVAASHPVWLCRARYGTDEEKILVFNHYGIPLPKAVTKAARLPVQKTRVSFPTRKLREQKSLRLRISRDSLRTYLSAERIQNS